MSIRGLVVFGAGYVLGTRAGRERYQQIVEAAGKAAQRIGQPDLVQGSGRDLGAALRLPQGCDAEWCCDDGRSLAQGAVVETRLCARLLGVKLLVVDGVVTLTPRQDNGSVVVVPVVRTEIPAVAPADAALGAGLDESARRLEANAHKLSELG